jgi:curli biogenesis system outer membrane secretion channel CsgG
MDAVINLRRCIKMKKPSVFFITVFVVFTFLSCNSVLAQAIPPKAKATPSGGPTIDQAQKEDAMGPKARVAVTKFIDKSAKGKTYGAIGDGMAEMLANALFATNRFIVLERQSLDDVIREQDLGASGRVKKDTAAKIGEIEGADLLVEGTITEFEPGASGAGGAMGGLMPGPRGRPGIGGMAVGVKTSHVALIVKVIDAKTSRRLASEQVEGKATDIGGVMGFGGPGLAGVFGGFSKTPMEKAIRVAIEEGVRVIVTKTPTEYYRVSSTPQPQPIGPPQTKPQPQSTPSVPVKQTTSVSVTPTQPPVATSGTESKIIYVKWPTVSLREGPGTDFKAIADVKKGAGLAVLEEKGQWFRVKLEDGKTGWIGKATVSESP